MVDAPRGGPLADLAGKDSVVESLALAAQVAREHGQPLGHVLLSGPPGPGKIALARALAGAIGTRVQCANGALVRGTSGIVNLLAGLGRHDVLFIDEIHRLPPPVAAVLREALKNFRLSLRFTTGAEVKTVGLRFAPFTLIGATTHPGLLPQKFLSHFDHLEYLASPRRDASSPDYS